MLLSSLPFASFLSYTPRAEDRVQENSRELTYALKRDRIRPGSPPQLTTVYLARGLAGSIQGTGLEDILGPEVLLVPMPSSSKPVPGGLWIPQRLADALVGVGLGESTHPLLKRIRTIPKSASSGPGQRPTAQLHYETLEARRRLLAPDTRIVLVDDVITSGATMLGAASVLAEEYPFSDIKAFAMVRTISNASDFSAIILPCIGKITRRGDFTHREP